MEKEWIQNIQTNYGLVKKENQSAAELEAALAAYIRELIANDFEKLIYILYRVDVQEKKIKTLLETAHEDSAILIARLIIDREIEKYKSRKAFKQSSSDSKEEKW